MTRHEKIVMFVLIFFAVAMLSTVAFIPVKGRYVSGEKWFDPDTQLVVYHQLGTKPLELDLWCSLFLLGADATENIGPAVPCSDYQEVKIQVIAVTSTYISLWNYGPSRVIVNVVASP